VEHGAIDLGKFHSQIAVLTEGGELVEKRIRTERGRLEAFFGRRPRMRILIEASTESEWVARCVEGLGHEVVVADPNYAPMYARRNRKVKTDRRDARGLVEANRLGAYRPAYRPAEGNGYLRAMVAGREALVRSRTRLIGLIESIVRRQGYRVRSGGAETFARRVEQLELIEPLRLEIGPLLKVMAEVNTQIREYDERLETVAGSDAVMHRLMTMPFVGPVTAVSYVIRIERVERFSHAHEVEAYLGLVPSERSSGEKQHRGEITRTGDSRLRYLLVEAGWNILMRSHPQTAELRAWGQRIAVRRGRHIAAVALARRLTGILYAMWRDGTAYHAEKLRRAA
jgi:transposase